MLKTNFILLIVLCGLAYGKPTQFGDSIHVENIFSSFTGVCVANGVVFTYGSNGLILYSTDKGTTWKQHQVSTLESPISSLKNFSGILWGITYNGILIRSTNLGTTWDEYNSGITEPCYDIEYNGTEVFILSKSRISVFTDNVVQTRFTTLDTTLKAKEFRFIGNKLIMPVSNGRTIRYNASGTLTADTINLPCLDCGVPNNIVTRNDSVYVAIGSQLYISRDTCTTWQQVCRINGVYNVLEDGNIYTISSSVADASTLRHQLQFYKINEVGKSIKISTEPNPYFNKILALFDFQSVSSDTIIAVGYDKTIYRGTQAGTVWELLSYAPEIRRGGNSRGIPYYSSLSESRLFRSTNFGTTWLPQQLGGALPKTFGYSAPTIFDRGKTVCLVALSTLENDKNFAYSQDSGKTFTAQNIKELTSKSIKGAPSLLPTSTGYILFYPWGLTSYNWYTDVVFLDSNFRVLSAQNYYIDSVSFILVQRLSNGELCALGDEHKGTATYAIYKSSDEGKSWFRYKDLGRFSSGFSSYYAIGDTMTLVSVNYKVGGPENFILSRYYPLTEKFDYNIFSDSTRGYYGLAKLGSMWYMGGDSSIYINANFEQSPNTWQKVYNDDYFSSVGSTYDGAILMNISKGDNLQGTIVRQTRKLSLKKNITTSVVESKVENAFLYTTASFPNPTKTTAKSTVYWDNVHYEFEQSTISVYDMFGRLIEGRENISFNQTTPYSGDLTWDASNVQNGVYYIAIQLGNSTRSIPVIVMR